MTLKQALIGAGIGLAIALGVIYFVKFETVLTSMLAFVACTAFGVSGWILRGLWDKYRRRWENISR